MLSFAKDEGSKDIRQPQYQKLAVKEYLHSYGEGKFHIFPFFKNLQDQENKSLRKPYEHYFMDKFKPLLNKNT